MEINFWFESSLLLVNRIDHTFVTPVSWFLLTQGAKPDEYEKSVILWLLEYD